MVDFRRLSDRAKDLVEKRGGTEGLKQDAERLREVATGKGSLSDKAKAAAAALKEQGGAQSTQSDSAEPAKPKPDPGAPTKSKPTKANAGSAKKAGVGSAKKAGATAKAKPRKAPAERKKAGDGPA